MPVTEPTTDTISRENLGFLLAKASQRWNELLAAGFSEHGFSEVRPSYGSVLVPLFEEDSLRIGEIARRSRGTPRVANRLLRRVRDFAEVRHDGTVTSDVARAGLELFEVDEEGLDKLDLAILSTVVVKFGGGPVGLSTLSAAVGEETDTIEDVVEPYLLQLGLLQRTPRGRLATERAYRHLGVSPEGVLPLT